MPLLPVISVKWRKIYIIIKIWMLFLRAKLFPVLLFHVFTITEYINSQGVG